MDPVDLSAVDQFEPSIAFQSGCTTFKPYFATAKILSTTSHSFVGVMRGRLDESALSSVQCVFVRRSARLGAYQTSWQSQNTCPHGHGPWNGADWIISTSLLYLLQQQYWDKGTSTPLIVSLGPDAAISRKKKCRQMQQVDPHTLCHHSHHRRYDMALNHSHGNITAQTRKNGHVVSLALHTTTVEHMQLTKPAWNVHALPVK
jgi:hypothetical protein